MFELPFCTPLYYSLDETAYWLVEEDQMARPVTKLPTDYHITEYPCGCKVSRLNEASHKAIAVVPCGAHECLEYITEDVTDWARAIDNANRGQTRITGIGGSIQLGS